MIEFFLGFIIGSFLTIVGTFAFVIYQVAKAAEQAHKDWM